MNETDRKNELTSKWIPNPRRFLRQALLGAGIVGLVLSKDNAAAAANACADKYVIENNTVQFVASVAPGAVGYDYQSPFHARVIKGGVRVTGEAPKVPEVSANPKCSDFVVTFVDPRK